MIVDRLQDRESEVLYPYQDRGLQLRTASLRGSPAGRTTARADHDRPVLSTLMRSCMLFWAELEGRHRE